ncbi:hypothetical protein ACQUSR_18085 [Streptomyces sp. P1-3]|uniref:hypothetical protein n=1 Tax=Streptomyces sp. P1-3 TaxID=3421658 RepID=UPI003D3692A3
MIEPIRRLFEQLIHLLLPSSGRHRAATPPTTWAPGATQHAHPLALTLIAARPVLLSPLGDDLPLVRPYVLTPEERQERQEQRAQRSRRRALWLAVHGIDVGPRWIHGVEVAAQ